jgi:hypothetical protein
LPGANRTKPVAGRAADDPPPDPRLALAHKYLKTASTEAAEKEVAKPRAQRDSAGDLGSEPRAFSLSISPPTFVHLALAAVALTFASLAVLVCYHFMMTLFDAGRIIALPVGIVVAAVLSYLSVLFLGIIESTSLGQTNVESLQGDWREWFWTLPSTLGMLAIAAFIGWLFSVILAANVWLCVALAALLLYPILQLSTLETTSPFQPLSLPVLISFGRHPFAWFVLYAISFAMVNALWYLVQKAWRDPPYLTVAIVSPLVAIALFFYAWLLGQLAFLISSEKKS